MFSVTFLDKAKRHARALPLFIGPAANRQGEDFMRFALLSGFLAMVGLLLTAVGLYGILSYSVVRRTRDIGVRLALGADPQRLARWAIMDIAKVVGAGLVVGLAAGLVVAPLLVSLLYGVQPWSFWSLAAPVGALLLAAALAAVPPARRAARIDPVVALRYE